MSRRIVLGLDTSNYTTSAGLMTEQGEILANLKLPLPVKEGQRGLRQSDALFAHTVNLPVLMERVREALGDGRICAVGVSTRPRNLEGSYMPCFLAGVSAAASIGMTSGVPIYRFSHQCGHIAAAMHSCGKEELFARSFYALHVSGGTTDLCRVTPKDGAFVAERIGGTADLNAGQLVDRIGVHLGLSFPAGPAMQALAGECSGSVPHRRPTVDKTLVHLSGAENLAKDLYARTQSKSTVCRFVFQYLAEALLTITKNCFAEYGEAPVLFAGGVMANTWIRAALAEALPGAAFAEPSLSADNGVGIAYLAQRAFQKEQ